MSASTLSRRRASAHAEARAAKERKQKIILVIGVVLLALLLVWEMPKVLKSSGGGSSSSPAPVPAATPSAVTPATAAVAAPSAAVIARDYRTIRRLSPHDVFGRVSAVGLTPSYAQVGPPPGVRDPFDPGSTASSESAPAKAAPKTPSYSAPLPAKIVIGTPGSGRVAKTGWIVILASIPTSEGRASAAAFQSRAQRKGVDSLKILNSSNEKPLRGGYWVVYSGPYSTIAQVTNRAAGIHSLGFGSAYIRELVVYRAR
jgi:hypothetical protein